MNNILRRAASAWGPGAPCQASSRPRAFTAGRLISGARGVAALGPAPVSAKPGPRGRGQALAELAIILPVLLLLMVGGEEVARLAHTGIVASHAAHAGALYGSQNSATVLDNAGMVGAALADGQELGGLSATAAHVCTCANGASSPTCSPSDCSGGRLEVYAQVNTTATFNPACSFLGWPSPVTLHRQALIRARP